MERVALRTALALALWACACAPAPPQTAAPALTVGELLGAAPLAGFALADGPRELAFPADHGPHPEFQSEWWYVTGHLQDESGARYGWQVTLFRRGLRPPGRARADSAWECDAIWMGHAALLEIDSGRLRAAERFEREALGLASAGGEPLAVRVADWSLTGSDADFFPLSVRAGDGAFALELELAREKPLVLHGERGWSRKGPGAGDASHYYSATRLATRGRLQLGGRELAVAGSAWLDREWSSGALGSGQQGWDWFALQLDDGRELMLYLLRGRDGARSPFDSGTLVARDGAARALAADEFELAVLGRWTSPASGVEYPARWRLRVPGEGLDFEIVPCAADAELRLSLRYWEGPADVLDRARDGALAGRAYVELVGYGDAPAGESAIPGGR